ncbi:spore germination cell wall hydrolase CwlJ-like protein [Sphingomonas trueperi]|uniref:cell wall hydrolase n=1 Tax=Sphingomonas trueperi TaxID=53317 RepID=UPI00339A7838
MWLRLVLGIVALAALVVPTLLVINAPTMPHRARRVPPVALPNRVVPKEELPPVEPVAIADLAPEDARAFNASIPFSTDPNPAARPFHLVGAVDSQERAVDCLAAAEVYEAGDDALGERAVAQVILNRVRHPAFPKTVCGVVFQGSERSTGCQFTFSCDGAMLRWSPTPVAWARAREIAKMALHGAVFRPVGHATHYHTDWVVPYWSASLDKIVALHTHLFFRWAGWWGTPPAFNRGYVADEPKVALLGKLSPAHLGEALPVDEASNLPADLATRMAAIPASAVPAPVTGDPNVFLILLPKGVTAENFPALAMKTCGERPYCKFMAWSDPAKRPPRLPPTGEQAAAMSFSYLRDDTAKYAKALWNCEQFARPVLTQCMRRAVPLQPFASPTPTPVATPAPATGPSPLDGVRRKPVPAQNKAGAAAPATPASSTPGSD